MTDDAENDAELSTTRRRLGKGVAMAAISGLGLASLAGSAAAQKPQSDDILVLGDDEAFVYHDAQNDDLVIEDEGTGKEIRIEATTGYAKTDQLSVNEGNDTTQAKPFVVEDKSQDGLAVHADGEQVNVRSNLHPDWGSLFVGPRPTSSAGNVDVIASLGDDSQSVDLSNNNDGVWGTRFGDFRVDSSGVTLSNLANIYIPNMLQSDQQTTVNNRWSIYDPNGTVMHDMVCANTVDAEQASISNPRTETRQVEAFAKDSDTTTNLSMTATGIGSVDQAEMVVVVNGSGGGTFSDVNIQLNGVTSGDYNQRLISGTSIVTQSGNSQWNYQIFNTNTQKSRFMFDVGTSVWIRQLTGTNTAAELLDSGRLIAIGSLDSVTISTGFNAGGRVYIIGVTDT